jgi:putative cardiolipin synthase
MRTQRKARLAIAAAAALVLSAGCATLPPQDGRTESHALADTAHTRIGRATAAGAAAHPGKSGIHAIPGPPDAFAARVLLAAAAEKSLDIQYYIWNADHTGVLLYEAAWRAADRGVRVRILLDDANTAGLDPVLAALDAHPNIEVRLYNPLAMRNARLVSLVSDFARVNRRMHNKSFTADNQASIVGGRNVGDEYFAAGEGVAFADLDVLAVGPVVSEVSAEFDLYWNSPSAYDAASLVGPAPADAAHSLVARFQQVRADPASLRYIEVLRNTQLVQELLEGRLRFEWAHAKVVSDDPAKTLDTQGRADLLLLSRLLPAIGTPTSSFDLVSPYFVPGEGGTAVLAELASRGVSVRVLTNALATTDVAPVHAGYASRRCALLRAGVRLYELKASAAVEGTAPKPHFGSSSSVELHAKTFAVDRARIFVGSFNFDQRSAYLNTEMGIVIDSAVLASRLASAFDADAARTAYEVRVASDGRCPVWIDHTAAGDVVHDVEPGTSAGQRALIELLQALPIEWLL